MAAKTAAKKAEKKEQPKKGTTIKQRITRQTTALESAYNAGYANGWNDHARIPNVIGARTAATTGYSKGQRDRKRTERNLQRVKKGTGVKKDTKQASKKRVKS